MRLVVGQVRLLVTWWSLIAKWPAGEHVGPQVLGEIIVVQAQAIGWPFGRSTGLPSELSNFLAASVSANPWKCALGILPQVNFGVYAHLINDN